ncbi:MAG: hypothetical protein AAF943_02845 [Pseudomonadota bacterium]
MTGLAKAVLIASAIFFAVAYLLNGLVFGAGFGVDALVSAGFYTIMFAMVYAALRVAMIVFKEEK